MKIKFWVLFIVLVVATGAGSVYLSMLLMDATHEDTTPAPTATPRPGRRVPVYPPDAEYDFEPPYIPHAVQLAVPILDQRALGLPHGCEIVSLAMLIAFHNGPDSFCLDTLVDAMPRSPNPRLGFRGNPRATGFTILPAALLPLANQHLDGAFDMTGASLGDLRAQLAAYRPVMVWVGGRMHGFTVHAVVVTGYNRYGFYLNDPWTGEQNYFMPYVEFLQHWNCRIRDFYIFDYYFPPRMAIGF